MWERSGLRLSYWLMFLAGWPPPRVFDITEKFSRLTSAAPRGIYVRYSLDGKHVLAALVILKEDDGVEKFIKDVLNHF